MDNEGTSETGPLASRTGFVSPLGKLEYPVKTHLPNDAGPLFERLIADAGYKTDAEFVRDLILKRIYGKTLLELCEESRRSLLGSEVPYVDHLRTKGLST